MAKRKPYDPLLQARSDPASVTSFRLNPAALRNEGYDCAALLAFPRELFACKNLESLELFRGIEWDADNTIPPEIGGFAKLTSLTLGGLTFKKLPDTIGKLTKLTSLDVTYSEELKEIPTSIGQLTNLVDLQLGGTALKTLPSSIGKLRKLRQLTLGDKIKALPKETWSLEALRDLALPDALRDLPPGISKLRNLESLSISAAALDKVASELPKLKSLKTLNVGGSAKRLPDQLGELASLEELSVSYLGLRQLPPLSKLANLRRLEVAGNELTELASVVGALPKLVDLDFSENKLPKAEKKLVEQLMRLPPAKRRGGGVQEAAPRPTVKPKLLGAVTSINASLSMLVADAPVAATWRGVENGESDDGEGSDWDRLRDALKRTPCAPIATMGGQGLALSLEVGQGRVEVFRVGEGLVLVESFHGAEDDAEERALFLDYVARPPERAKKVGVVSSTGGLVFMPSTDACPDVAKRRKPASAKGVGCGSEESGLMVAVTPGKHQVLLEPEAKGSWGSGRRCHIKLEP